MRNRAILVLLLMSMATACGERVDVPKLVASEPTPSSWEQTPKDIAIDNLTEAQQNWWTQWHDATLDQLIHAALQQNPNLLVASERVREARALVGVDQARWFPQVGASAGAQRGNQGMMTRNKSISVLEASFDVSWELDLFGRNAARVETAQANARAAAAQENGVRLSLIADVVRAYTDLRYAQMQQAIAEENIGIQQDALSLAQTRLEAGLTTGLDEAQAATLLKTTQAQLPFWQAMQVSAEQRLKVLIGQPLSEFSAALQTSKNIAMPKDALQILLQSPAQMIAIRPDIQARLAELEAAAAQKDLAYAAQFPSVSLSGLFGIQDALISDNIWKLGAGIAQPLLTFGRIESEIDARDARAMQAFQNYRATVQAAVAEVETNLSNYAKEGARQQELAEAVVNAQTSVDIATERYQRGISAYMDVLTAQTALYETQSALAESQAKTVQSWALVYKALGIVPPATVSSAAH